MMLATQEQFIAMYNTSANDTIFNPGISNFSVYSNTSTTEDCYKPYRIGTISQVIITFSYVTGALGDLLALLYLRGKRMRNRKHVLMLRSLALNGLVALVGMMVLMNIQIYVPELAQTQGFCVVRVVWRLFGLGSGCIAGVMAVERFLALTQPFLYQKHVTYGTIRSALISLWLFSALLTCLPFAGFGLYYNADTGRCMRYRDAEEPADVAYAYLFFSFGVLLCICIVWCNLAVVRVLCHIGSQRDHKVLVRRISRASTKALGSAANRSSKGAFGDAVTYNTATAEEVSFAKLMAVLCITFMICWLPQLITILLAQMAPHSKCFKIFVGVSDMLMLFHFTLDPYIYVLFRGNCHSCLPALFKSFKSCIEKSDSRESSMRFTSGEEGDQMHNARQTPITEVEDGGNCDMEMDEERMKMPLKSKENSNHFAAAAV